MLTRLARFAGILRPIGYRIGFVLGIAMIAGGAQAADGVRGFDHARLASQALARVIEPGYARLAAAGAALTTALERYCTAPAAPLRNSVDSAFDELVTSWGRVEAVRFGPITANNRHDRFLFWPDRKGLGAKQISKILSSADAGVLDAAALAKRSIAVQGLGALERVLFDPAIELAMPHPCGYARAIATNLSSIAHDVAREWSDPAGYRRHWLTPGPGNPAFLQASETTLALATSFDELIERMRDDRLAGPLGMNELRQKKPAPLALSGRTMRLFAANIAALQALLIDTGAVDAIVMADPSERPLMISVQGELEGMARAAEALVGTADPFVTAQQQLIALGFPLKSLRIEAGEALKRTAGLAVGFNSSDGD